MNRRTLLRSFGVTVAGLVGAGFARQHGAPARAAASPVVDTAAGRIRGFIDGGVHVFKGVRYGEDTSSRRFLPPTAVKPWTGVRDAIEFGPVAPQPGMRDRVMSADC